MDALFWNSLTARCMLNAGTGIYLYPDAMLTHFKDKLSLSGHIYMIGGSTSRRQPENSSWVVTRIKVGSGAISRIQLLLELTSGPAAASLQNMIAVCGGSSKGSLNSTCQVYSVPDKTYV